MKTKPSNSTPLPIPYQDEANDEYHVVDNDNGIFEGTGSGQDFVQEEDKFPRAICLFRNCLGGEFCYKCEGRTSRLLVCTENGCPVAIHEVCMITEPAFDDTGKFYCPYCWYKREVERTDELRREALLAERDLSNYNLFKQEECGNEKKHEDGADNMKAANPLRMEGKNDSGDSENGLNHEQVANPSTMEGKNDSGDSENVLNHEQTICVESVVEEKSISEVVLNRGQMICVESVVEEKSISTAHGSDNVAGEQLMQEEDIENTYSSENEGNGDDDPRRMKPCSNPNHFEIVNDTLCLSTKGTSNIAVVLDDNREKWVREEPVMPNALGTSMALITTDATSNVPAIESFEFVSPDLDTMALIERKKCIKHTAQRVLPLRVYSPKNHSFQPGTSLKERKIYQQGEATPATNSVQCQEVTKRIMNPTLGCGKRRRLNWTTEEEDMLKVRHVFLVPHAFTLYRHMLRKCDLPEVVKRKGGLLDFVVSYEGVQRFSLTINKNIPWRKILEFGHNVFDNNRVSADLKDKWKKIMAKEDPKCDKGTLVRFEE